MSFKTIKCSDIIDVRDGTHDSPKYLDKGYPLITSKNIMENSIDFENVNLISEEDYNKINMRSSVKNGDILMPMIGTVGNPVLVNTNEKFAIKNVALFKLSENSEIDGKYFYYLLMSDIVLKQLEKNKRGGTQSFVSLKNLRELKIPYIGIEKQKKIVSILDKSKGLIDKRKEQIKLLDELVKSRFMEMFGDIKDYVTVSEYIESLTAGKSLAGESECQNKVLNTGSVSYDYYDETQAKNLPLDYLPKDEHLVNKGDVLISRMNTAELVGATAYVWKSNDHIYIPDRLWKANFKSNVNPVFVWQLLIQRSTKEKIRRIASGTSGSMKNVSKSGLLGIEVIKVDIDKQNEFATFVKQVHKLKFEMEESLKELEDNFNSLMKKAFKGELF